MGIIIYSDGTQQTVTDNQALKVYDALIGKAEATSEAQAAYLDRVADVVLVGTASDRADRLAIILHDPDLYGLKRAKAVADYLKRKQT